MIAIFTAHYARLQFTNWTIGVDCEERTENVRNFVQRVAAVNTADGMARKSNTAHVKSAIGFMFRFFPSSFEPINPIRSFTIGIISGP